MTAVHTPGTPGPTRRGRIVALAGGIIASIALIVGALQFTSLASPKTHHASKLTCENAQAKWYSAAAKMSKVNADDSLSNNQKHAQLIVLRKERDAAKLKVGKCIGTTTAPPSGEACKGVTFSPYAVAGTKRFGPAPVDVTNPGSPQDVANAFVKQLSKPEGRWLSAAWSQGSYLVDGGIGTSEVQAKAQSFVTDPAAWRATNNQLRGIMGRATFELKRSNAPYATQEAIVSGTNQCVAPAAQDVGTAARGERLILVIHLAKVDGGRTVTVVVDCDGQIWITGPAPAPRQPAPHVPTTAPPAVPTTRPYTPPTTAPPTTTTAPPTTTTTRPRTTTTLPNKPCTKYPDQVIPGVLPLCDGGGTR